VGFCDYKHLLLNGAISFLCSLPGKETLLGILYFKEWLFWMKEVGGNKTFSTMPFEHSTFQ